jgi:hypothetical protein
MNLKLKDDSSIEKLIRDTIIDGSETYNFYLKLFISLWRTRVETVVQIRTKYEGISKSFRTGRLERDLQMAELSAIRCSCSAIL